MTSETTIGPFLGLQSTTRGETDPNHAADMLNVSLDGGILRPRLGYKAFSTPATDAAATWGFAHLKGYDETTLAPLEEYVAIEGRSGTVRPVSIHPVTGARTPIVASGMAEALWTCATLKGDSYWVCPDSPAGVYRHKIGDGSSWVAVQNVDYQPPGSAGSLTLNVPPYKKRGWVTTDSVAISSSNFINGGTFTVDPSVGTITIKGSNNDNGVVGTCTLTITFPSGIDLSGADYLAIQAVAGAIVQPQGFSKGAAKIQIKSGTGAYVTPEGAEFISSGLDKTTQVTRLKGVAGLNNVTGIKFQIRNHPQRYVDNAVAFTVQPLFLGGSYVCATATTKRLWDASTDSAQVTYGVRWRTVETTPKYSVIQSLSLAASRVAGSTEGPSCPLGSTPTLSPSTQSSAPYVLDDGTGGQVMVQFVRQRRSDSKWVVLGELPNVDGQQWVDTKEEWELAALSESFTGTVTALTVPETPYFNSLGFTNAFSWRNHVVWLKKGGASNVLHSAINNAVELSNPSDVQDGVVDPSAGATFTLADSSGDQGVCGVGVGSACVILGEVGAYVQVGDTPQTLTPPRQVVGAPGVCGRLAVAAMPMDGQQGAAYVDRAATRVLWIGGDAAFATDSAARPIDLTLGQAGAIRGFLMSQTGYDAAQIRLAYNRASDELWVLLGRRALVLRAPSPLDGARRWEQMEYAFVVANNGTDVSNGGTTGGTTGGSTGGGATSPSGGYTGDRSLDVTYSYTDAPNVSSPSAAPIAYTTMGTAYTDADQYEEVQQGRDTTSTGGTTTPVTDTDNDGIPDVSDPFPNDPTNGSGTGGTGGGTTPGTSKANVWTFVTFAEPRRTRVLDWRGRVLEMEWSSADQAEIAGANRDGGLPMPPGWWAGGWRRGPRRRLTHIAVDPPTATGHAVSAYVEGVDGAIFSSAVKLRWEKVDKAALGWTHRVRVDVAETSPEVRQLTLREILLSSRLDK